MKVRCAQDESRQHQMEERWNPRREPGGRGRDREADGDTRDGTRHVQAAEPSKPPAETAVRHADPAADAQAGPQHQAQDQQLDQQQRGIGQGTALERRECRKKGLRHPELHGLARDAQAEESGEQDHHDNMPVPSVLHNSTLPCRSRQGSGSASYAATKRGDVAPQFEKSILSRCARPACAAWFCLLSTVRGRGTPIAMHPPREERSAQRFLSLSARVPGSRGLAGPRADGPA